MSNKFNNNNTITTKVIAGLLYVFFYFATFLSLKAASAQEIQQSYDYKPVVNMNFTLKEISERVYEFTYTTFDGEQVKGQLSYPTKIQDKYPVLIGLHAMGRNYQRWWVDAIAGKPTVTQVHQLTEMAQEKGYVVVAIDARHHGVRKVEEKSLKSIMHKLWNLDETDDYIDMISKTTIDHRVLIDWVVQQPQFDINNIHVAGYSMGGQISLLLAGVDKRVSNVLSIVPPNNDEELALVAPTNIVHRLNKHKIWMVSANDDKYANKQQNSDLFDKIATKNKKHITIDSGHILPADYVTQVAEWF